MHYVQEYLKTPFFNIFFFMDFIQYFLASNTVPQGAIQLNRITKERVIRYRKMSPKHGLGRVGISSLLPKSRVVYLQLEP